MQELDFELIQNSVWMLTTPNLMYIACYFPAIVLIYHEFWTHIWYFVKFGKHISYFLKYGAKYDAVWGVRLNSKLYLNVDYSKFDVYCLLFPSHCVDIGKNIIVSHNCRHTSCHQSENKSINI